MYPIGQLPFNKKEESSRVPKNKVSWAEKEGNSS